MLPHWVRHYCCEGSTFSPADVYVLDHDSVGDSAELLQELQAAYGFNIIRVHHPHSYDDIWLANTVRAFQDFLLYSYDVVTFAAADEFLLVQPTASEPTLAAFLQRTPLQAATANGVEVVHHHETEPPLLPADPILRQRSWWYSTQRYSKTLIARHRLFWNPGFYTVSNVPPQPPDPQLWLLHLHRVDYDLCLRRHREINAREWLPRARRVGPFRHNLIEEHVMLSQWLLCNADDTSTYARLTRIPDWIKDLL